MLTYDLFSMQYLNPVLVKGGQDLNPSYYHGPELDVHVDTMTSVKHEDWTDEVVDVTYYMGK